MQRTTRPRTRRWTTDRLIRFALAQGTSPRAWAAIAALHARGTPGTLTRIAELARSTRARRRALGLDIAAAEYDALQPTVAGDQLHGFGEERTVVCVGLRIEEMDARKIALAALGRL